MNAVETHRLSKLYGRHEALGECTLSIPAGRSVALVGPNGAGKTTLLQLAVGLGVPSRGSIRVLGDLLPGSDAALGRIGFVAQDAPLYPQLTVDDTLHLVASLSPSSGWDEASARRRLAELEIPTKRRVGHLSGGQHAQVALAVAVARHPELLILDEPVARLDPLARHEFLGALMSAVAEDGMSVIFSSHAVAELERVCDYLIVLSRGRVQVSGDVDELLGTHWSISGPTDGAGDVRRQLPVVFEQQASRLTTMLVRVTGRHEIPDGWAAKPTALEELVLAYMRSPSVSAHCGLTPIAENAGSVLA
jgi:ABC-2 type transport system ATP-binding protein